MEKLKYQSDFDTFVESAARDKLDLETNLKNTQQQLTKLEEDIVTCRQIISEKDSSLENNCLKLTMIQEQLQVMGDVKSKYLDSQDQIKSLELMLVNSEKEAVMRTEQLQEKLLHSREEVVALQETLQILQDKIARQEEMTCLAQKETENWKKQADDDQRLYFLKEQQLEDQLEAVTATNDELEKVFHNP